MTDPYTPGRMDAARTSDETPGVGDDALRAWRADAPPGGSAVVRDIRIDDLRAEASKAVTHGANTLRTVIQRYRVAYADELSRWQALRDDLDAAERYRRDRRPSDGASPTPAEHESADADARAENDRIRMLQLDIEALGRELGQQQTELARLEIALKNVETTWLFLERGDSSLVNDSPDGAPADIQMRIVEAQESERSRLAQEVHDGPAQVLSNAIFQVEYIERVIETDLGTARTELQFLRDLLRRELGTVRTFISQLRPPVLDELGLDGAIGDAIGRMHALTGLAIDSALAAPTERLTGLQQTVVLRVAQEALQNVRKHGAASAVTVASAIEGDDWVLSVRDDGRGFDVGAVAARGRRNFGLQFMRERAELIGAQFEVHSRPDGGTLVRLAIPVGEEETA
jgi:two-component system, NarL family, sensor histidine kinase DegS